MTLFRLSLSFPTYFPINWWNLLLNKHFSFDALQSPHFSSSFFGSTYLFSTDFLLFFSFLVNFIAISIVCFFRQFNFSFKFSFLYFCKKYGRKRTTNEKVTIEKEKQVKVQMLFTWLFSSHWTKHEQRNRNRNYEKSFECY